jgi:phosphatidylglycerophosphate synthase
VLLVLKSLLDAVDGSLARARGRPSRVGRFLDSVCDYFVNAAVLLGIGWSQVARTGSAWPLAIAVLALEAMTWQGTTFNYYYVRYRHLIGGDTTSRVEESDDEPMPWDDPEALRVLLGAYRAIYGWQDRWTTALDRWITRDPDSPTYTNKRLLSLTTTMGLGFQLLLFAVLSWLGMAAWIPWLVLGPYNLLWALLMVVRRFAATRAARRPPGR